MKKKICVIAFLLASLYPIAELTRYIIAYQMNYGFESQFQFELGFAWTGYIIAMYLFCIILWTKWED